MLHNICFCRTKLSTAVKSTQWEGAREACEKTEIREMMVTKLQEKGRPCNKKVQE
jgi:hypothetical protein